MLRVKLNPQRARCNSSAMNATAFAQALIARAATQTPAPLPEPEGADLNAQLRGTSQRLTVWEERARKMGFPPSPR